MVSSNSLGGYPSDYSSSSNAPEFLKALLSSYGTGLKDYFTKKLPKGNLSEGAIDFSSLGAGALSGGVLSSVLTGTPLPGLVLGPIATQTIAEKYKELQGLNNPNWVKGLNIGLSPIFGGASSKSLVKPVLGAAEDDILRFIVKQSDDEAIDALGFGKTTFDDLKVNQPEITKRVFPLNSIKQKIGDWANKTFTPSGNEPPSNFMPTVTGSGEGRPFGKPFTELELAGELNRYNIPATVDQVLGRESFYQNIPNFNTATDVITRSLLEDSQNTKFAQAFQNYIVPELNKGKNVSALSESIQRTGQLNDPFNVYHFTNDLNNPVPSANLRVGYPLEKKIESLMGAPVGEFVDKAATQADDLFWNRQDEYGKSYSNLYEKFGDLKNSSGSILNKIGQVRNEIKDLNPANYNKLSNQLDFLENKIRDYRNSSGVPFDTMRGFNTDLKDIVRGLDYTNERRLVKDLSKSVTETYPEYAKAGEKQGYPGLVEESQGIDKKYAQFKQLLDSPIASYLAKKGSTITGKAGNQVESKVKNLLNQLKTVEDVEGFKYLTGISDQDLYDALEYNILTEGKRESSFGTRTAVDSSFEPSQVYGADKNPFVDEYNLNAIDSLLGKEGKALALINPERHAVTKELVSSLRGAKNLGGILDAIYKKGVYDPNTEKTLHTWDWNRLESILQDKDKQFTGYISLDPESKLQWQKVLQIGRTLDKRGTPYYNDLLKILQTAHNTKGGLDIGDVLKFTGVSDPSGVGSTIGNLYKISQPGVKNLNPSGININTTIDQILSDPILRDKIFRSASKGSS